MKILFLITSLTLAGFGVCYVGGCSTAPSDPDADRANYPAFESVVSLGDTLAYDVAGHSDYQEVYVVVGHDQSGALYERGIFVPATRLFIRWRDFQVRRHNIPRLALNLSIGPGSTPLRVLEIGQYERGHQMDPPVYAARFIDTDGRERFEIGFWSREDGTLYVPLARVQPVGEKPPVLGGPIIISKLR